MKAHIHTWAIDPPRGEWSTGRCECGAEREFRNYDTATTGFNRSPKAAKKCIICGDPFESSNYRKKTCHKESCVREQRLNVNRASQARYKKRKQAVAGAGASP